MATRFVMPNGYSLVQTRNSAGIRVWRGYKGERFNRELIVEDAGSREYVVSVLVDHANGWFKPNKAESDQARAERHQEMQRRALAQPPVRYIVRGNIPVLQVRVKGEWIDVPFVRCCE